MKILAKSLFKLGVLKYFNFSVKTSLNGVSVKIPIIHELGINNIYDTELWMCDLLKEILKIREGGFIDVGVNTGQTLLKVKSIRPDIIYYGFEPNPNCNFYLQQLIKKNKFSNVVMYPVAIANETKLIELNFFGNDSADASASIIPDFRPDSKIYNKVIVPCLGCKDIQRENLSGISCIKIDVEGAELEVLQGVLEIVMNDKPFIIIEILPVYDKSNCDRLQRQQAFEQIMQSANYKILRIHKKNVIKIERLEQIETIGIHTNTEWCDYVMCHESDLSLLSKIGF